VHFEHTDNVLATVKPDATRPENATLISLPTVAPEVAGSIPVTHPRYPVLILHNALRRMSGQATPQDPPQICRFSYVSRLSYRPYVNRAAACRRVRHQLRFWRVQERGRLPPQS
jgi:hypothetical protein